MCGGSKTSQATIKKCEIVIILSSTPRDSTHHTMAIKFVWGQIYIFLKVHTTVLLNALFVELMLCFILGEEYLAIFVHFMNPIVKSWLKVK